MSKPEDDDLPSNVIRVDFRARRTLPSSDAPAAPELASPASDAAAPVPTEAPAPAAPKPRRSRAAAPREVAAPGEKKKRPARTTARASAEATDEPTARPSNIATFPGPAAAAPPPVEVSVRVELDPSELDSYDERRLEYFDRVIQHGMVAVTFDPRRPGVSVPPAFATRPELMLNFSLRFHIADFAWDAVGVRASLSFDDGPFFCEIPWSAVWLMVSKPTYSAYAVPFAAPPERRGTIPGMLRSIRTMLEQLPPPPRP